MGAVEDAQIAAAAQAVRAKHEAAEEVGVVSALVYVLSMVADDLSAALDGLEDHDAETLLQHALGLVTGSLGVLAGVTSEALEA